MGEGYDCTTAEMASRVSLGPAKAPENQTVDSKREMDILDALRDITACFNTCTLDRLALWADLTTLSKTDAPVDMMLEATVYSEKLA